MTAQKRNLERVPKTGWGVCCGGAIDTDGIPVWGVHDTTLTEPTDEDRAVMDNRKQIRYPIWLRAYGLWNVSKAQLLDPTWIPVPHAMLDDACMFFTMILCPAANLRSKYWPFNFDRNGFPRMSRHQIGHGIRCHHSCQEPVTSKKALQPKIETFLVWKRHHVFGGAEISNLTLTEGNKDVRMKLSNNDPNYWSHGTRGVPIYYTVAGDAQDLSLRFYLTDDGLDAYRAWSDELIDANLKGHWFDVMRRLQAMPFKLDRATQELTPNGRHNTSKLTYTSRMLQTPVHSTQAQSAQAGEIQKTTPEPPRRGQSVTSNEKSAGSRSRDVSQDASFIDLTSSPLVDTDATLSVRDESLSSQPYAGAHGFPSGQLNSVLLDGLIRSPIVSESFLQSTKIVNASSAISLGEQQSRKRSRRGSF